MGIDERRRELKVPWTGNRCILCLREDTLCEEHLIPEALGGRLTSEFLCVSCNSKLGHDLEASAKSDPSIIIAAKNLKEKIPLLAKTLIDSHPHIGHSEPGPVRGYIKNNEFRVLAKTLDDGSFIQPTDEARKSLARILQKSGYEETPIRKALFSFDEAPENMRVEIERGLEVVKWRIHRLEPDMSRAQTMDPLIPAKTAYEFLACHVGSAIYNDAPNLSQVRASISTKQMNPKAIQVERLSSNKYEPFHGICFEGNDPYAKVQIRLFGWLAFRVHFLLLSISGPRLLYTHRLDTNEERVDAVSESPNNVLKMDAAKNRRAP